MGPEIGVPVDQGGSGWTRRAVQQLEIMKQQKVPPTSLTYGRLIYALEVEK
jgi:hypothetical protein